MMLQPGLVSVTFKDRSPGAVIELVRRAGLKAIEWHGLNHVPHGDLDTARRVGQSTREAGLEVAAYGSYYVVSQSESTGLPFATVLNTAEALGAPMIRIWAGDSSPNKTLTITPAGMADEIRRIADQAAGKQIKLVFEFHPWTLTETGESCAALMETVDHSNVGTYWQPDPRRDGRWNLAQLQQVLPWLTGLHVFQWFPTDMDRHPLSDGEAEWAQYLAMARQCHRNMNALLEFVKGDSVDQFKEDAATLHRLLK